MELELGKPIKKPNERTFPFARSYTKKHQCPFVEKKIDESTTSNVNKNSRWNENNTTHVMDTKKEHQK